MIRGKGALSLNSIADVWKNVLDRLRSQLSETTINTWFDEVEVVTMEDSAFVLHCSNSFKKSTIEARFMSHIKAALKDPEFIKKQEGLGAVVATDKRIEPAEQKKFVQSDIDQWGAVI